MSNVLVYSGPGVSSAALTHTLSTLRMLLPSYDVQCVTASTLAKDPWQASTSLVVLPGGRDLPYVQELGNTYRSSGSASAAASRADERLHAYVNEGGAFLGICAGAYYASSYCDFERGTDMEVCGARTALKFFPGTCKGTAYPGFVYESDAGARIVTLTTPANGAWRCAYNGGGAFIDAETYADEGVEVIARYAGDDAGIKEGFAGHAAALHCAVGKGKALLFGTHPEFPLHPGAKPVEQASEAQPIPSKQELEAMEVERLRLFGTSLKRLGLNVSSPGEATEHAEHKLTPLIMLSSEPGAMAHILQSISNVAHQTFTIGKGPPDLVTPGQLDKANAPLADSLFVSLPDTHDTFHFYAGPTSDTTLQQILQTADYEPYRSPIVAETAAEVRAEETAEIDLHRVPKYVLCYPGSPLAAQGSLAAMCETLPDSKILTPHFNVMAYMRALREARQRIEKGALGEIVVPTQPGGWPFAETRDTIGDTILYGQVVTSTQTILDKNYKFLQRLPTGTAAFATHQVSGRGRGKNAWISPLGCLQFSAVLSLPSNCGSGLVFVQYLAALAIVEAVRGALGPEYAAVGRKLRIKWPNDVYADVGPARKDEAERKGTFEHHGRRWAKCAGVLINSQFAGKDFKLIAGCGINCLNERPTTSISDLIVAHNATLPAGSAPLPVVSQEQLGGAVLATLEKFWRVFVGSGGSFAPFKQRYSEAWLHADQITTISDAVPGQRVRIVGITSDHASLRAVPEESTLTTDSPGAWGDSKSSGPWIDLKPDGNSFDMLANLLKPKAQ